MKRLLAAAPFLATLPFTSGARAQELPAEPPVSPPVEPSGPALEPAPNEAPPAPPPEISAPPEALPPPPAPPTPTPGEPVRDAPVAPPPSAAFDTAPEPARAPPPRTAPPATPSPVAAVPASVPAPAPPPEREPKKDDGGGLFGPIRIGPTVGVGLPGLLAFGGMLKLTRYFAAGVDVSIIPNLRFSFYGDASIEYQGYELYGRIHPFGGGFYVGANLGYAHVSATYEETIDVPAGFQMLFPEPVEEIDFSSQGDMQTLVLSPGIGYFHTWRSGFSLGVGAGLQIPVAPSEISYSSRTDPNLPDEIEEQVLGPTDRVVQDTLESVGQSLIPRVELRLGWLL